MSNLIIYLFPNTNIIISFWFTLFYFIAIPHDSHYYRMVCLQALVHTTCSVFFLYLSILFIYIFIYLFIFVLAL